MEMPMGMINFLFLFIQYICVEQLPHERQDAKCYKNFYKNMYGPYSSMFGKQYY